MNPLTRKRKLSLADLIDEPWALEAPDTFFGEMSALAFSGAGLSQPKATVVTNSRNLQYALLETGHFLSLQAAFLFALSQQQVSRAEGAACHAAADASPIPNYHAEAPDNQSSGAVRYWTGASDDEVACRTDRH